MKQPEPSREKKPPLIVVTEKMPKTITVGHQTFIVTPLAEGKQ